MKRREPLDAAAIQLNRPSMGSIAPRARTPSTTSVSTARVSYVVPCVTIGHRALCPASIIADTGSGDSAALPRYRDVGGRITTRRLLLATFPANITCDQGDVDPCPPDPPEQPDMLLPEACRHRSGAGAAQQEGQLAHEHHAHGLYALSGRKLRLSKDPCRNLAHCRNRERSPTPELSHASGTEA